MPTFFVPNVAPHEGEAIYEELARLAGLTLAPDQAPVFSVVFIHESEVWSAKVGERLYGRRSYQSTFAGRPRSHEFEGSDAAVVLAIFSGASYTVVTDGGQSTKAQSRWPKVFSAGRPVVVERFHNPNDASQCAVTAASPQTASA